MEVQENDIDNFKKIEELIYKFPLPLLNIKNQAILNAIDDYLPYSCGMEFECFKKDNHNDKDFGYISNILDVNTDNSEQRYRIPNGLKGMICLYEICKLMKEYSSLDLRSSNHYHFDFTDMIDKNDIINKDNENYILDEIEKWETAKLRKPDWIRFFNSLGTLEIRIGEPTFDYDIIIKRLIDGCRISKHLKDLHLASTEEKKLIKLQEELKLLNIKEIEILPVNDIKQQLKSRTNKI